MLSINLFWKKKNAFSGIEVSARKTHIDPEQLIKATVEQLFETEQVEIEERSIVHVEGKFGFDGSAHSERNQHSEDRDRAPNDTGKNYVAAFWSPLKLQVSNKAIMFKQD